jgi:hypothetical protein
MADRAPRKWPIVLLHSSARTQLRATLAFLDVVEAKRDHADLVPNAATDEDFEDLQRYFDDGEIVE